MSKKLFSKPDEMEAQISYHAMKITWVIVNLIFVGGILWFSVNGNNNPVPLIALLLAEAVYFTVRAFLKWKLVRGGADNE